MATAQATKNADLVEIWYAKNMPFRSSFDDALDSRIDVAKGMPGATTEPFTIKTLEKTHAVIAYIDMSIVGMDLDEVYDYMQAENWSANGEARDITMATDTHTSMSIGDVIYVPSMGQAWECATYGWRLMVE